MFIINLMNFYSLDVRNCRLIISFRKSVQNHYLSVGVRQKIAANHFPAFKTRTNPRI